MAGMALAFALGAPIDVAAGLPQGIERFDLGSQLMLRLFGETSDANASFAAAHGDRSSESPLRDLALQAPSIAAKPGLAGAPAIFPTARLALRDLAGNDISSFVEAPQLDAAATVVHFAAPAPSQNDLSLVPPNTHFAQAYQPVAPQQIVSPAPGTLAFATAALPAPDLLSSTARVGPVQFEGQTGGVSTQSPQVALGDTSYGAGANFDVRAGKRNLNVSLSSAYEHLTRNDADAFSAAPLDSSVSWQLPGSVTPLAVPSYADLNRLSLGAGVSVPVLRGLTLNFNYDAQRLYGGYGLPGLTNLNAVNNTYGGNLTFSIPQISSALSIGAYQDRLQDSLLPNTGYNQTREDVNFTVKF